MKDKILNVLFEKSESVPMYCLLLIFIMGITAFGFGNIEVMYIECMSAIGLATIWTICAVAYDRRKEKQKRLIK